MGVITQSLVEFVSAEEVYAKVSRFLSSFNVTNSLDVGEFSTLAFECMQKLNIALYNEQDAVCIVRNHRAKLPDDFREWYSAVKVSPYLTTKNTVNQQGQPIQFWNDITCEVVKKSDNCEIDCCKEDEKIISKITIRQYLGNDDLICNYRNPLYLRLSPNVQPHKKENSHIPKDHRIDEVTIRNGYMFVNFNDDHIYMKYYADPIGEDGLPIIPDIVEVKKAIEWYIIYQTSLSWWWNSEVPDIQNKWQQAQAEYEKAYHEAVYILKLPRFSQLINSIRNKRAINKVTFFGSTDWQRM